MLVSLMIAFLIIGENLPDVNCIEKQATALNKTSTTTIIPSTLTTTRRPFLQGLRVPCSCSAGQCGCCTNMIQEIFRQKACLNITYEPDEFAVNVRMSINDRVLYKNSFSGKNPPPFCIPVPRFRFIEFCVQFSNIYFAQRNIHMCIDADASWQDFTLLEWSFDCVRVGVNGVAVIPEEAGGGIPATVIDEEDQTDEDYDDNARNVPLPEENDLKTRKFVKQNRQIPVNVTMNDDGDLVFVFDDDYDV